MDKNYKFTGETKEVNGITLNQIVAIKDIPKHNIKVGDIGGWIEKYENLSDNAWVFGNARVYGDAWDKSPLYIQGTRWSVCMCDKTHLKVGCQVHTLEEWGKRYKEIAKQNNAEDSIDEYYLYYELACKLYGCE